MLESAVPPVRMRRLSRSAVINKIERIVRDPLLGSGRRRWSTSDVECIAERHSFNGHQYSFHIEVMRVRTLKNRSGAWELCLVTEYWRNADDETIHMAKWLKLISGKAKDVTTWLASCRAEVARPQRPPE